MTGRLLYYYTDAVSAQQCGRNACGVQQSPAQVGDIPRRGADYLSDDYAGSLQPPTGNADRQERVVDAALQTHCADVAHEHTATGTTYSAQAADACGCAVGEPLGSDVNEAEEIAHAVAMRPSRPAELLLTHSPTALRRPALVSTPFAYMPQGCRLDQCLCTSMFKAQLAARLVQLGITSISVQRQVKDTSTMQGLQFDASTFEWHGDRFETRYQHICSLFLTSAAPKWSSSWHSTITSCRRRQQ